MKGKTFNIYKIFIFMAVILTASICVVGTVGSKLKFVRADYGTTIANQEFSYVDTNNIIMAVEKVGVLSDGLFNTELYKSPDKTNKLGTMLGRDNNIYYADIANDGQDRYVVHNGEYVMLNNKLNSNYLYYNANIEAYAINTDTNTAERVNMQEAIMFSFGQYVYSYDSGTKTESISKATATSGANIQYINVIGYRNGNLINNLPGVRQYANNNYQDFVYVITQEAGNEGYYEFLITYRVNNTTYTAAFNFYILYNTTYEGIVDLGNNNYNIEPNLYLKGNSTWTESQDKIYHYSLSKDGNDYPILTYDYTKYDFSYTHTSNGVVTNYDYSLQQIASSAKLLVTKTVNQSTNTITYPMDKYLSSASNNIVSLVFTEMGSYTLNFKYVYRGYNSENAPGINLPVKSKSLAIHGFELKYSKAGYLEADMRYVTFARGTDRVDLIVPNGYDITNSPTDEKLGIAYSFNTITEQTARVGTVSKVEKAEFVLGNNLNNSEIDYVITNQGSLWLNTNDSFDLSKSFYYYSPTKMKITTNANRSITGATEADGTTNIDATATQNGSYRDNFTNSTTFNKVGYYIVEICVTPNSSEVEEYTQWFAFQYKSNTLTMTVTANGTPLGSGGYTNQDVSVTWEPAGVFERAISAKYYTVKDRYYDKQQLLTITGKDFTSGVTFTEQGSYLIELKSEGATTTYRMFTIDKTAISGITMYAVEAVNYSNEKAYTIRYDSSDYPLSLNSLTNELATIYWSDKASGAKITAEYSFTPFVKDSAVTIKDITLTEEQWINTKYSLGSTISGFSIDKVTSLGGEIGYQNVLYSQGIYVFTLTDEAGNSCKYMFIIDNTEAYFKVDDKFTNATSTLSASAINVTVGTHKTIELSTLTTAAGDSDSKKELYDLIKLFAQNQDNSQLADKKYFIGSNNNISALKNIFTTLIQGGNTNYIMKVANNSLTAYEGGVGYNVDKTLSISKITRGQTSVTIKDAGENSSVVYRLHLLGANQTNDVARRSKSYVLVEVNTDNAQGMFYSMSKSIANNLIANNISDDVDTNANNGIYRRYQENVTSDECLTFTWKTGINTDYEVVSLTMKRYQFSADSSKSASVNDKTYYFYDGSVSNEILLYNKDSSAQSNMVQFNDGSTRGLAIINNSAGATSEGLYVITRKYSSGDECSYYVFVDRNGIIESQDSVNGGSINIGLLENETIFNEFASFGGNYGTFSSPDKFDSINNKRYNIYLTTDKIPAVLNIPLSKYFYSKDINSSNYSLLDIKLYFKDTNTQLENKSDRTIKLFDSTSDKFTYDTNNGYFSFSILQDLSAEYRAKFTRGNSDAIQDNWLFLQGDYILVIRDRVQSYNNAYSAEKIIGFKIAKSSPTVDIYSVLNEEQTLSNAVQKVDNSTLTLTTNDEFVKINLDVYDETSTQAQVDINYLEVKNITTGQYFINYPYTYSDGYNLTENSKYVTNTTTGGKTSRVITLDTGLVRNADSSINVEETLKQQYVYEITVRYKLGDRANKYGNCYYSVEKDGGNIIYKDWYEVTYTVIIDRQAPTQNISNLMSNDNLVQYYNDEPMSVEAYELPSGVYYQYQYTDYYKSNNTSDIYVFVAYNDTDFNYQVNEKKDITKLYYNTIDKEDLASYSLTLPITFSGYTEILKFETDKFGGLSELVAGNYYEILEVDSAGNITQYVLYYSGDSIVSADDLTLTLTDGTASVNGEISTITDTNTITLTDSTTSTLFDINKISTSEPSYRFYRIDLLTNDSNSTLKGYINTNLTTVFNDADLGASVVRLITKAGFGNYTLRIVSDIDSKTYTINYLDKSNIVKLNIDKLIQNNTIVFGAANVKDTSGEYYINYADRISVTYGVYINGEAQVINEIYTVVTAGEKAYKAYTCEGEHESKILLADTTYVIEVTDPYGNQYIKRINLGGKTFESISFGEFVDDDLENEFIELEHYEYGATYYSYHNALIQYDTTIYTCDIESLRLNNSSILNDLAKKNQVLQLSDGLIYLKAYWGDNKEGGLLEATINLLYSGVVERTYRVIIDTRTGNVMLLDTSNNPQTMKVDTNLNFKETSYNSTTSGTMNLSWTKQTNDYFVYEYVLHELTVEGWVSTSMLNTHCIINTESNSTGKYVFEIKIYSKDNEYIGNKLYTFSVQAMQNQLYYVQTLTNEAVRANSTFYFEELTDTTKTNITNALKLDGESTYTLPSKQIPLYIYNQELKVIIANDQGANSKQYQTNLFAGKFTVYRIYTNTYSQYIGILWVTKSDEILNLTDIELNYGKATLLEEEFKLNRELSYTIYGTVDTVSLAFNSFMVGANDSISKKNLIIVDVYHNDIFVGTYSNFDIEQNRAILTITGSGKYSFVFHDLAGNTHKFITITGTEQESIEINLLRELNLLVNGEVPVMNGFYNDAVTISIYSPAMYDLGSIKIDKATLNGASYSPIKSQHNYTFSGFGTYRVTFEASYKNAEVTKTIVFTIINPKEARESIDLSSIGNYEIRKVTNINNEDVTDNFLNLIYDNAVSNGMYLTYDRLLENADDLGVTTGKQTFTITYVVTDDMYPSREVTFAFTLNNEQPTIECSLKSGESTTKGFTLKLNAGIIYDQVGEAVLYINNQALLTIDENSATTLSEIKITRSEYGTGDFYIRLMSTSGNVIDSFKVEIKEPLNVWAIIVIVVVAVAVIGVTVTIIVLRTRMRIR